MKDKETENRSRIFVDTKYHYDLCVSDKQFVLDASKCNFSCDATDNYRSFISNDINEVLKEYDRDTNDKTLRFNGYQEYMDGNWYKVKEDGLSVYYFERGKVDE